ncbi:hypothetical protein TNIN_21671 [Trichonephila inaurata madagascariensis]|uniref:Uncharacterized protein n=1 Tax=Trichonephila inaurata madagascariensis TaxID=2747483 RepID=A0A8X6XYH1_9ARAC|nr:hypothetical protein TNIN_21671 [Trichonephila inaurata madagascariensis]
MIIILALPSSHQAPPGPLGYGYCCSRTSGFWGKVFIGAPAGYRIFPKNRHKPRSPGPPPIPLRPLVLLVLLSPLELLEFPLPRNCWTHAPIAAPCSRPSAMVTEPSPGKGIPNTTDRSCGTSPGNGLRTRIWSWVGKLGFGLTPLAWTWKAF